MLDVRCSFLIVPTILRKHRTQGRALLGARVIAEGTFFVILSLTDVERPLIFAGQVQCLGREGEIDPDQCKARMQFKNKSLATLLVANPNLAADEAKAVVLLFLSTLNERQRRLYAGLESLKLGYGGDSYIADLFGMDPHTAARGRRDLQKGNWDTTRLRAREGVE